MASSESLREQVAREVGAVRGLVWPNGPVASEFALREADAAIRVVLAAVAEQVEAESLRRYRASHDSFALLTEEHMVKTARRSVDWVLAVVARLGEAVSDGE